jgi:hypothetical protein
VGRLTGKEVIVKMMNQDSVSQKFGFRELNGKSDCTRDWIETSVLRGLDENNWGNQIEFDLPSESSGLLFMWFGTASLMRDFMAFNLV